VKRKKNIYCIWLITNQNHHVINDYVEVFSRLEISRFNVINSIDQHYWIFFAECNKEKFNKLREWAISKLGSSALMVAVFQVDPDHRYFSRMLGRPLYGHPSSDMNGGAKTFKDTHP